MLHIRYELGKPGKKDRTNLLGCTQILKIEEHGSFQQKHLKTIHNLILAERERRHYPWLHNQSGTHQRETTRRGRLYIPHQHSLPEVYQPQMRSLSPEYSENGPDWKSKIRYIPSPHRLNSITRHPEAEIWDINHYSMRSFPNTYLVTNKEWSMHPESDEGIKTYFQGVHRATQSRLSECQQRSFESDSDRPPTRKRPAFMIDERNGRPNLIPGDKSYSAAEFSPGFYRDGAPVSTSIFGFWKKKPDTFIPILKKSFSKGVSDRRRKWKQEMITDIESVIELEKWRASPPLRYKTV